MTRERQGTGPIPPKETKAQRKRREAEERENTKTDAEPPRDTTGDTPPVTTGDNQADEPAVGTTDTQLTTETDPRISGALIYFIVCINN